MTFPFLFVKTNSFGHHVIRNFFTSMGDINQYFDLEPFRKSRNEFRNETHRHSGCHYEQLLNWHIIGTTIRIKVLIRICKCRPQKDKSHFLGRKTIQFLEIKDGVEAHFDDRCHFNEPSAIKGEREFRKVCYCERPHLSYLR